MRRPGAAAVLLCAAVAGACGPAGPPPPEVATVEPVEPAGDAPPAVGRLRVSLFGGAGSREPLRHDSTWVRGVSDYEGCDTNDLRGYLDGTFKWGWNQVSQSHVRVGRREGGPRYGEYELFRAALRWADVTLPPDADVESARLTLSVETGPDRPARLLLYEINGDWDPGGGGVAGDNVSPPREGEVWWRDRGYGVSPWGLPGVGFAADGDPGADTPATALAVATWEPGDATVVFDSEALAASVASRAAAGRPLGFLVKRDDWSEDRPGSVFEIYSCHHGADGDAGVRPRLDVVWTAAGRVAYERDVILEYGRRLEVGPLPVRGATIAMAAFEPADAGSIEPTLRSAALGRDLPAHPVPLPPGLERLSPVLVAARRPVRLGDELVATVRDTWIRSGPPETQRVPWAFVAPSGAVHEVEAEYAGDWTWRARFEPDELGPWRARYGQRFVADRLYLSEPTTFDVVRPDRAAMLRRVEGFVERVAALDDAARRRRLEDLRVTFMRLERAAVAGHTPESFRGADGAALRDALNDARELLGGRAPAEIPLEPSPPADWQKAGEAGS